MAYLVSPPSAPNDLTWPLTTSQQPLLPPNHLTRWVFPGSMETKQKLSRDNWLLAQLLTGILHVMSGRNPSLFHHTPHQQKFDKIPFCYDKIFQLLLQLKWYVIYALTIQQLRHACVYQWYMTYSEIKFSRPQGRHQWHGPAFCISGNDSMSLP